MAAAVRASAAEAGTAPVLWTLPLECSSSSAGHVLHQFRFILQTSICVGLHWLAHLMAACCIPDT